MILSPLFRSITVRNTISNSRNISLKNGTKTKFNSILKSNSFNSMNSIPLASFSTSNLLQAKKKKKRYAVEEDEENKEYQSLWGFWNEHIDEMLPNAQKYTSLLETFHQRKDSHYMEIIWEDMDKFKRQPLARSFKVMLERYLDENNKERFAHWAKRMESEGFPILESDRKRFLKAGMTW
eukprot:TRINITY_DN4312_c0_g1_i1.p1 TRINITY_DN4312_c0_g1~~TRINITY_DN4312_c0_g1_i1.p1  ORF type:complete len:180 (+),score=64.72 TRINITY_DN4312_c0_g1_i1:44-583(+)